MKHTSRIAMVLVCFWITDLPAQVRDGIGAQDLPLKSTGNLRFFVDLSAFRGPEGYTRQEVALLLDASQLATPGTGGGVCWEDFSGCCSAGHAG